MGHPQQMGKDENYPANMGYPESNIHPNGYLVVGHSKH